MKHIEDIKHFGKDKKIVPLGIIPMAFFSYCFLYIFCNKASSNVFEKFIFKLSAFAFINLGIFTVFFKKCDIILDIS